MSPFTTDLTILPVGTIIGGYLTTSYVALKNATDIVYTAEVSSDLLNWQSGSGVTVQTSVVSIDTARQRVTVRDSVPTSAGGQRSMRVRVTRP